MNTKVDHLEFHLFSDASIRAYGTIAYLRVKTSNDDVRVGFGASKKQSSPFGNPYISKTHGTHGCFVICETKSPHFESVEIRDFMSILD